MSDVKHTPGPWVVEENVKAGGVIHLAVTNRSAGQNWMPCSVTPMRLARPVDYSNARLIAAAPELLEALRVLVAHLDRYDLNCCFQEENETNHLVEVARDVIAKATEAAV